MMQRDIAARDDALTLEQVLAIASNGGVALGRPQKVGGIAVGQAADLVVVDTSGPHHFGVDHPVPALALHARPSDVTTVVVDGKVVVDDGQLVGIDVAAMFDDARQALQEAGDYRLLAISPKSSNTR